MKIKELKKMQELFDETPKNKARAFENPTLWMIKDNKTVFSWTNTQPLYFYPFSLLDFINKKKNPRELQIFDVKTQKTLSAINQLEDAKVHFENIDEGAIGFALDKEHKVSVICDLEHIDSSNVKLLSNIHYLKVRINVLESSLKYLELIPNERLLSCVKIYLNNGDRNYMEFAKKVKNIGIDLLHVSKKLEQNSNPYFFISEQEKISKLLKLNDSGFSVKIPSNLERVFNQKFKISYEFNNTNSCSFSHYRRVLYNGQFHPCYTLAIMDSEKFGKKILKDKFDPNLGKECDDCACIYENDIVKNIKRKSERIKNPKFVLGYNKNGN